MMRGSCLCGGVRFEVDRAVGPFELCHCSRCRKASGSALACRSVDQPLARNGDPSPNEARCNQGTTHTSGSDQIRGSDSW
jgi:hypothetical protein